MTPRKLFISHSSKTPENVDLLRKICARLGEPGTGYAPLWDGSGNIEPGSDWYRRLDEWLAECHAAVILFSDAAHDSLWVQKEAAILSWRRELEARFTLVPVPLEKQTPDALEQGLFGVLRIAKDQCLRDCETPEAIAQGILDTLAVHYRSQCRTPFERLQHVLAEILEKHATTASLEDAWYSLEDHDRPLWRPGQGDRFAAALARYLLRDRLHAQAHLLRLLNRIRPLVAEAGAVELIKYLRYLWVDPGAAGLISSSGTRARIVALNALYPSEYTGVRYKERAWPLDDLRSAVPVQARWDPNELLADIIAGLRGPGGCSEAIIKERLRRPEPPIVVLVPPHEDRMSDLQMLEELRGEYPALLFVVGTGPRLPQWLPPACVRLEPELEPDVEMNQHLAHDDLVRFLGDAYGRA